MEKGNAISRRDFLKYAGLATGSFLVASCAPRVSRAIETLTPVAGVPTEKPTPTETITPTPPIPEALPMHFGEFDMRITPFSVKPSPETELYLGYGRGELSETFADTPLPFGISDVGSDEQLALQEEQNKIFEKAGYNHPKNPYYVILSDLPNHMFFNFHSVQESAPGEYARAVGSIFMRKPEYAKGLYGKKFIINFNYDTPVEAEIVHVTTTTREYFDDLGRTGPWYIEETDASLRGMTSKFEIPDTIRHDRTPGVYYMSIIGCQSENGEISLWLSRNTVKRSLLTLKFTLP